MQCRPSCRVSATGWCHGSRARTGLWVSAGDLSARHIDLRAGALDASRTARDYRLGHDLIACVAAAVDPEAPATRTVVTMAEIKIEASAKSATAVLIQ